MDGEVQIVTPGAGYPLAIVEAINAVMTEVTYVQKGATNTFQNYKYASDGAILAKVQPAMAKAGLIFFQDELKREFVAEGTLLAITYTFTLAHKSGVVWPIQYHRTGMSACRNSKGGYDDKSANKCQTAARKYFILGLFLIPTGEDEDPDAHDGDTKDAGKGATKDTSPPPQVTKPKPAKAKPVEPALDVQARIKPWCNGAYDLIATATKLDTLLGWEGDAEASEKMAWLKANWTAQHERLATLLKEKYVELEPANG